MSTGAIVAIVLGALVVLLAVGAGVVVFAVGNSTNNADRAACEVERASLITAVAAARLSNEQFGGGETWNDYMDPTAPMVYFVPSAEGFERVATDRVPATQCASITAADTGG